MLPASAAIKLHCIHGLTSLCIQDVVLGRLHLLLLARPAHRFTSCYTIFAWDPDMDMCTVQVDHQSDAIFRKHDVPALQVPVPCCVLRTVRCVAGRIHLAAIAYLALEP